MLSGSRFIGELLELTPESVAWLEDEDDLRPRTRAACGPTRPAPCWRGDANADAAAHGAAPIRRREVLRLAFSATSTSAPSRTSTSRRSHVTENLIDGVVRAVPRSRERTIDAADDGIEFAVIAMGRFGGQELGFGSDADVMYVYRPAGSPRTGAVPLAAHRRRAERLSEDAGCRSTSMSACAPRARTGRSRVPSAPTRRTTRGGRSPGRLRRCSAPAGRRRAALSRRSWTSPTRALPGGDRRELRSARSSASRPGSRANGCPRAPTRCAASSSGRAR